MILFIIRRNPVHPPPPSTRFASLPQQEELSGRITARDRCALEYLEDVRYVRGPAGMAVEFHFAPANPYFNNRVRRRVAALKRYWRNGNVHYVEWHKAKAGPR